MTPDSDRHDGALLPQKLNREVTDLTLPAVPMKVRALRLGSEIVVLLACLISVGCAGGLSGSNPPYPNPTATARISGKVSQAQNGSGATVILSGAASATTTADASGNYSFTALGNGLYFVSASKPGFHFSPVGQNVTVQGANVTGVNFTAPSSQSATISGSIIPGNDGSGATVTLSGGASATTTADASGNYNFIGLSIGSYTVTANKNGFNFSPASQDVNVNTTDVTGVNFNINSQAATVNIHPGMDIPSVVKASPAGTTFVIDPGVYRLTQSIVPKNGDSFFGQTACAPPTTSCPAVISGSTVIGPLASFDGTNYQVTGQTQHNPQSRDTANCDPGWQGCIYAEDLFFDGVPYRHLYSSTLPTIGPGQWWFDYPSHVIYFHDNPNGHTVETSVLNTAFGGVANNITIQYLTVQGFADMSPYGAVGGVYSTTPQTQGANWTIQNCEVLLNHGVGVRVGYGTQVLNNYIHDNGQVGIGGGVGTKLAPSTGSLNSRILIQGNIINHNDYAHFFPQWGSGGFKIGSTSGVTLRGNTIQFNEGAGIHFDDYSQSELVDGNTITDNSDADGLVQEIGYGTSTFRNNLVLRNGAPLNNHGAPYQISSRSSAGVNAYCNVMEIPNHSGVGGWVVGDTDRGNSAYPPYQYLVSIGNSFHHNTVIWDAGATGMVGFLQTDSANQANFFANDPAPDFNTYHVSDASKPVFVYNLHNNAEELFSPYQANGADVHGSVDANNTSGYPAVSITSPGDQSSVGNPLIAATASDASGISKVEFYVDWALQATATSAPYNFNWTNGTAGQHTVAAMAYSNAGIRSCYAVTLNKQ